MAHAIENTRASPIPFLSFSKPPHIPSLCPYSNFIRTRSCWYPKPFLPSGPLSNYSCNIIKQRWISGFSVLEIHKTWHEMRIKKPQEFRAGCNARTFKFVFCCAVLTILRSNVTKQLMTVAGTHEKHARVSWHKWQWLRGVANQEAMPRRTLAGFPATIVKGGTSYWAG